MTGWFKPKTRLWGPFALALMALTGGLARAWLKSDGASPTSMPAADASGHRFLDSPPEEAKEATSSRSQDAEAKPVPLPASSVERPHPMTTAHKQMAARRELLGALVGALGAKDLAAARALLAEAAELRAADSDLAEFIRAVEGYHLILACLDAQNAQVDLTETVRQAAQKYIDNWRLSPRRDVRRVCLEGRPFKRHG